MPKTDSPLSFSPLSLRSVRAEEFLPPISRWTTWGGIVLVSSVGIAIALSAVLQYNTTVRAMATVRPSGEVRIVQAEIDGTIESIEVETNQTVQQGDVIARLDRSRLETQQSQIQGSIQQSQLQLAQMDTQVQLLETQIAAERRSLDQEISVAQSELARNQRDYGTQQATTQADLSEAQAALTFARSEMQRYEQLVESGAASQLQLEEKQAAVRTAEAQVARAQAALNPSQASVAIAQARIAQSESTGRATLATLNRERETLLQRRSEIQTQLVRDQQELRQLEIELQRSVIRATSDGTVLRLNLRNVDQVVQSGDTIVEIAPANTALVIKAAIATQDIDSVKLEQPVRLRINACPFPDYGTLGGTVTAISADAIAPRSELAAPASNRAEPAITANYYEVTIQPEQTVLINGDRQCQLQAGMEAEANIIARQESFLQFALRKARLVTNL
jgi:HlyD family secretion protein